MHQYVFIVNHGDTGMDIMRSLLGSLIVLALPQGAGVLLIALASSWQGALNAQRIAAMKSSHRRCVTCASRSGRHPSRASMARRYRVSIWAGVRRI